MGFEWGRNAPRATLPGAKDRLCSGRSFSTWQSPPKRAISLIKGLSGSHRAKGLILFLGWSWGRGGRSPLIGIRVPSCNQRRDAKERQPLSTSFRRGAHRRNPSLTLILHRGSALPPPNRAVVSGRRLAQRAAPSMSGIDHRILGRSTSRSQESAPAPAVARGLVSYPGPFSLPHRE
jgi:hypothetical protein